MIIIKGTHRCKKEGCYNRSQELHFSNGNRDCDSCRQKHREYYKRYVGRYAERLSENYFKNLKENKKRYRYNHLFKKYKITEDGYKRMFADQNGRCGICEEVFQTRKEFRDACVDHNHETGKVRGLLCRKCNLMLAYIENNKLWEKAQNYLNSMK